MKTILLGELLRLYKSKHADGTAEDMDILEPFADWTVSLEERDGSIINILFEPPPGTDSRKE